MWPSSRKSGGKDLSPHLDCYACKTWIVNFCEDFDILIFWIKIVLNSLVQQLLLFWHLIIDHMNRRKSHFNSKDFLIRITTQLFWLLSSNADQNSQSGCVQNAPLTYSSIRKRSETTCFHWFYFSYKSESKRFLFVWIKPNCEL